MSTALVPLAPAVGAELAGGLTNIRPRADFVAQLIATAVQAPQTRTRRRAEPHEAIGAYRAGRPCPALAGRAFSRSL